MDSAKRSSARRHQPLDWWGGKTSYFVAKCVNIWKLYEIDDFELYKFEFSENFFGFRTFRTQRQLNVVSMSNWSNFRHAFASRGFVSDSWAFLLLLYWGWNGGYEVDIGRCVWKVKGFQCSVETDKILTNEPTKQLIKRLISSIDIVSVLSVCWVDYCLMLFL